MTPHLIQVNALIQFALDDTEGEVSKREATPRHIVERVLYLDPTRTYVEMIDVDSEKAWNHQRRCDDVLAALECRDAVVLPHDYKLRGITAAELNERESAKKKKARAIAKAVETRDTRWMLIGDLVTHHVPDIFDPKKRGALVREVLVRTGRKDKTQIYDSIRRFWQRGMVKNALLGDYRLCGSTKQTDTGAKRGPKSSGVWSPGIARTTKVRKALAAGVHKFLKGKGRGYVQAALDDTIDEYFYEKKKDPVTGKLVKLPVPPSQRPTKRQFRTQIAEERELAPVRVTKRQMGEREYNRSARATPGSTEDLAWGAGTLFMIDWTVLPFSVLHPYRLSESLGCPTGYATVDFSTWFIPGVSVTLERGSWLGGQEAFEITTTEKVKFCEEFDYPLAGPEAWPADIAPDQLFADGGEFKSYNSDAITDGFHTTLANEPPYRPDLKALVEAYFALLKEDMFWSLPGVARRDRRRGDRDPRLDTVLTMRLATWVMIDFALWHNSNYIIPLDRMPRAALEDGVKRHPLDLWNWSKGNESGSGKKYERDYVRKHLLPPASARVDKHAIWVEGLRFTCARAEREQWFDRAAATGPWSVNVVREMRRVGTAFLKPGQECDFEPLELKGRSREYADLTWEEWVERRKASNGEERDEGAHKQTTRILRRRRCRAKVHRARRRRDAYLRSVGKTVIALTRGMQGHRRAERTRMRHESAWFRTDPNVEPVNPNAETHAHAGPSTPQLLNSQPLPNQTAQGTPRKPNERAYIPPPIEIGAFHSVRAELRGGPRSVRRELDQEATEDGKE